MQGSRAGVYSTIGGSGEPAPEEQEEVETPTNQSGVNEVVAPDIEEPEADDLESTLIESSDVEVL